LKKIGFLILLLILLSTSSYSTDIKITAWVDRTTIGLNEQFVLSVEISGSGAGSAPQPKLPDMDKFAAYVGSGSSQSIQFINGRMSVSKTLNYYFIAREVGKFQIGPVTLTYKGKTYTTEPIDIEIVKTSAQPQQIPRQKQRPRLRAEDTIEGNLFVKASVNKKRVYQNEPVILTYKIYTRVNVTSYGISKLPTTVGFWVEEFPLPQRPRTHEEILNGKRFLVAEIKKLALFPTNPGQKVIDPMEVECEIRVRERRPRDIFDHFFDDSFFGDSFFGRTVRRVIKSNPVTVEVIPLPETGKPANFSGAVGSFNITAGVDKNSVKTHEAVTLKVKLSGTGNIKTLPEPVVNVSSDFEKYEPKITQKISRKGGVVSGSKTFEYILIPRHPGKQRIKPIEFSYFDLKSKTYKTLRTDEIVIDVAKGPEEFIALGSGLSKEEVKLLGQDIRFIKTITSFRKKGSYFYNSSGFLVLSFLPLILLGASLAYRRHLDRLSGDVAYARSRRAAQVAAKRLRKAKRCLNENTQKEFYAEVSRALLGFLGDKLNLPEAGIITDQVEEMLRGRGVDDRVISHYMNCLRTCDYQRFAPSDSKIDQMRNFFEDSKRAIAELEREL